MSYFKELRAQIAGAMAADQHRLRNQLRAIVEAADTGRPYDKNLERFLDQLHASIDRVEQRKTLVPQLVYDESLPIVGRKAEIAEAIRNHPCVVVSGETGSGKSTQLPKICLEVGRGVGGLIGHTQPRRIAARSIASRLAEELGTSVGKKVGFKIRFTDQTSPETLVKLMTDGVLLAETQSDRFLNQYDTLIIDEAHERSLNIDFLLGYLHRLLPKRPDFRLIITSATIDAQRFAEHFGDERGPAPIIEVSGRTYPVEVRYRPLEDEAADADDEPLDSIQGVARALDELCREGPGDVLVFLPTERDILEASRKLRSRNFGGGATEIVPLYARLSTAEQNKVFQPHKGRRIVLATNVAESSLTVPGIRYVVDTGLARISRYSARSKVQRLPIEAVSQASADQRKGRCGRIGPGICVRLFSEDDFLQRDRFTSPEIQRTNLASVVLQTLALELGPLEEFPLLDPPRPEAIRDGYNTLFELGAVDKDRKLTPIGRQLSRLPVDPRIGRMLLAASEEGCLADMAIIAAALEVQDPRERPVDKQQAADEAHARFADPDSDFLGYLRLWDFYHRLKDSTSRSQLRKACQKNFLSELRLREWLDVHRQLLEMLEQSGLKAGKRKWRAEAFDESMDGPLALRERERERGDSQPSTAQTHARGERPSDARLPHSGPLPVGEGERRMARKNRSKEEQEVYASIHKALLAGLLSNVALRGDTNEYTGAGNSKFFLWPGAGPFASKPKWIVAGELVETTRRYARTVARIEPEWIEPLAEHLVNRSYSDPHWDRRSGGTMAYERVSLFGLPVVLKRRVRYGRIDPVVSRELFIRHGLAEFDLDCRAPFFAHNRKLLDDIQKLATKTRRRDLIVDPHALYAFYDARLPAEAYDLHQLDRWRREAERDNPKLLFMTEADVLGEDPEPAAAEKYPDQLEIDRLRLPLRYQFEPGAENDGITVKVPQAALSQLSADRLGWLVPGLLEEKIQALIKVLPKATRRNLVPAPDVAARVARALPYAQRAFLPAVAELLSQEAGESIRPEMFDLSRLPPHLEMNVEVVDDAGKVLAVGRDLNAVREQVGATPQPNAPPASKTPWHRDGVTKWDFGPLPPHVDVRRGGLTITQFPALVDAGEAAALRLAETAAQAEAWTRAGARRLFALAERRELKAQVQWLPGIEKVRMFAAPLSKERPIEEQLIDLLADRAFYAASGVPRTPDDYEAQRLFGRKEIVPSVQHLSRIVLPLFEAYHNLRLALEQKRPDAWKYLIEDLRQQLADLTPPGFLANTPWQWLQHYPRYLKGMLLRLQKMTSGGPARDKQSYEQLAPRVAAWRERSEQLARQGKVDPELTQYRWMLEELRVSLFAQELGTSLPVSPQRLDKQMAKVAVG